MRLEQKHGAESSHHTHHKRLERSGAGGGDRRGSGRVAAATVATLTAGEALRGDGPDRGRDSGHGASGRVLGHRGVVEGGCRVSGSSRGASGGGVEGREALDRVDGHRR